MSDKKVLVILVFLTAVSLGYALFLSMNQMKNITVPVSADVALEVVKNEPSAREFISENFGFPEDRIERVALAWDQQKDNYMWEIEIQERSCGCMLNETEGVTILKANVDPITGAIHNLSTRVGVPEETIKREACEKGCHVE
jgi:hypothetical protein